MENGEHVVDESSLNIQNDYFNNARKNHTRITVFLTNGQRIAGLIRSFDRFTLILETRNGDQMIFKHAITSVAPSQAFERDARPQRFQGPRPPGSHGPEGRPPMGQGRPPQGQGHGGPGSRDGQPGAGRPEGDHRARGASSSSGGKAFGNYMDLSSLKGTTPSSTPGPETKPTPAAGSDVPGTASAPASAPESAPPAGEAADSRKDSSGPA
jgi:host factor-I protein